MSFESLPSTVRCDLNDVCDAFEVAWNARQRPRIEDYLGSRTGPEQTVLFQMLLEVEIELRRKNGERPEPREYLERFEAYTEVVRQVFAGPRPDGPTEPWLPLTTEVGPDPTSPASLITTIPVVPPQRPAGSSSVPVPDRIGSYEVIRPLGRGNFQVYLGRDDSDGRLVAIKVARPDNPACRRRLMSLADEAEKLKALDHPRIVKLYEYVPPGGGGAGAEGYIVLEYVEGQTLEELLRAGNVPVMRLIRLVALVAETVHHAHTRSSGVVHRDLKPSNILLDVGGEPHVCDFGLAVDEEVQRLRRGEVAGTPPYMAPEQVRGETNRLDGRTDIWALGVILYRGLTGKMPFPGRNQDEIFEEILERDPRPLRMVEPGIEPELERICLRCLARPMGERYLTAFDLAADLNDLIDELPPPIPPPEAIVPKGLRPFDDEDARFFLALLPGPRRRDGMPESLRFWKDRLEAVDAAKTFSVGLLYGPSGGGKSSFVKAGLLPNLDRNRVRPVYIEATPEGTESRLLSELHRAAPTLPPDASLPDAVAIIRDDSKRRSQGKLVLVLDQLEQWLQAHPDEPDAELVRALRQCDGGRVQALVLVRDDFWMALTRFLQAVDVPLVQGGNAAAVELFDARHARKVLEGFGKALGQLPEDGETVKGEAALFLEEAVLGLTGADDRLIPMRLSLFTEVVRRRPWTPATLRALGGVDGIGVKFLDDCFASPPYKRHLRAAEAVLGVLLPARRSVIRGTPRSGGDLRSASARADQTSDFDELMRTLERDLKLVVSTDPDVTTTDESGHVPRSSKSAGAPSYQLAHDYLVRPIRRWLERKQGSTRKGRARLRLSLITASWLDRPGPRQLPSLLEWAGIVRRTRPSEWSPDERRLMRATARHYLTRAAAAAILVVTLVAGAKLYLDREHVRRILDQAFVANDHDLPGLAYQLAPYRSLVSPTLESTERTAMAPEHSREVVGILLYRFAPTAERGRYLCGLLLAAQGPERVELIRDSLAAQPEHAGTKTLLRTFLDQSAEPPAMLRIAGALARLAPGNTQAWDPPAATLTLALLGEDRRTIPRWLDVLGPALPSIVSPLGQVCRDSERDLTTRATAAETLAEALSRRGDTAELARMVVATLPDASQILLRELVRLDRLERAEPALKYLRSVLAGQAHDLRDELRKDNFHHRQAIAAVALAALGEPEALWPHLRHQDDPRLRSILIQKLAGADLPAWLISDRLQLPELDPIERQALLLASAETSRAGVATRVEAEVVQVAARLFLDDPHPGVHSAAGLLLRRWRHAELATHPAAPPERRPDRPDGPRWEPGPNGHTLAILPGPLQFRMGSPEDEPGRFDYEKQHYRRIDRSVAVATTEVTVEQFRAFRRDYSPDPRYGREPGCPAGGVSWYEAMNYCNWLSNEAKLDPSQWCYPEKCEPGMRLPDDVLDKTGYRLPTEAEWEYFCRGGTRTSRPFGESEELLGRYAWTWLNSRELSSPAGRLLPNEFGLFDMLGSLWEWCHDGPTGSGYYPAYPQGTPDRPAPDPFQGVPVNDRDWRVVRGGAFDARPSMARSAHRDIFGASATRYFNGFRIVRTLQKEGK
jgi:serine/threonine protein kinase/formylglycine-generating enzyme required for sulfatase activity